VVVLGKVVWDDPKLPNDSGEVPKPNKSGGGLIYNRAIVSLLDKKKTNQVVKRLMCSPKKAKRKDNAKKTYNNVELAYMWIHDINARYQ
jgi:hypothetical protein